MSWQVFVDDWLLPESLKVFSDSQDVPLDVPPDGIQLIAVDGAVHSGYEHYFWVDGIPGFWGFSNDTAQDILLRYPTARISKGRWTTFDRFHRGKTAAALWAGHNEEVKVLPSPVLVDGWRAWTSTGVVSTDGVAPADFLTHWRDAVPDDDAQVVMLYLSANGQTGAERYVFAGSSYYFLMPHPSGDLIYGHGEADPTVRYPGSIAKTGKFIDPQQYSEIYDQAMRDSTWPRR